MIRHELLAEPWSAFVRSFNHATCIGHGTVVARSVFHRHGDRDAAQVIYYDVRMPDGTLRTVTPDMIASPANVSQRTIKPAPLRIPAPPPARAFL